MNAIRLEKRHHWVGLIPWFHGKVTCRLKDHAWVTWIVGPLFPITFCRRCMAGRGFVEDLVKAGETVAALGRHLP